MRCVGIDLSKPCFSHGQLYVALSRVGNGKHLHIFSPHHMLTENIVYKEALSANENFFSHAYDDRESAHLLEDSDSDTTQPEDIDDLELHAFEDDHAFQCNSDMQSAGHSTETEQSLHKKRQRDTLLDTSYELPQGDHYTTIRTIAEENNWKALNVPGDGSCFFHALSLGMNNAGHITPPGDVLRTETGQYLSLPEQQRKFKHYIQVNDTLRMSCHGGLDVCNDCPNTAYMAFFC